MTTPTTIKPTRFVMAIAVQILIILGMILFKLSIVTGGVEVLLKIQPVDPRDPLRGDYLTFQYEISQLEEYQFDYQPIQEGDMVYVTLRKANTFWTDDYHGVSKTKPSNPNQVFIQGRVKSLESEAGVTIAEPEAEVAREDNFQAPLPRTVSRNLIVNMAYGIEEYFIPEGQGAGFNSWSNQILARVKIDQDGRAVLNQILVNEKPWP